MAQLPASRLCRRRRSQAERLNRSIPSKKGRQIRRANAHMSNSHRRSARRHQALRQKTVLKRRRSDCARRGNLCLSWGRNGAGKTTTIKMLLGSQARPPATFACWHGSKIIAIELRAAALDTSAEDQVVRRMPVKQSCPSWRRSIQPGDSVTSQRAGTVFELPMTTRVKHLRRAESRARILAAAGSSPQAGHPR